MNSDAISARASHFRLPPDCVQIAALRKARGVDNAIEAQDYDSKRRKRPIIVIGSSLRQVKFQPQLPSVSPYDMLYVNVSRFPPARTKD